MKIYALVGKSGTGKSFQAVNLCRAKKIDSIIDDGLFIYGNNVMAGVSAKRQPSMIKAIKTALFTDDEHMKEVCEKIREINPESILIIGTSVKMIWQIIERLDLPPVDDFIYIEDITTEKDRQEAYRQRHDLGKQVIPAPAFELRKEFSGYFIDPIKMIRTWGRNAGKTVNEKSVVRPTYSYRGEYTISDKVFEDIVINVAGRNDRVNSVTKVVNVQYREGLRLSLTMFVAEGNAVVDTAAEFQRQVCEKIEYMTSFNVLSLDIDVKGVR